MPTNLKFATSGYYRPQRQLSLKHYSKPSARMSDSIGARQIGLLRGRLTCGLFEFPQLGHCLYPPPYHQRQLEAAQLLAFTRRRESHSLSQQRTLGPIAQYLISTPHLWGFTKYHSCPHAFFFYFLTPAHSSATWKHYKAPAESTNAPHGLLYYLTWHLSRLCLF